MSDHISPPQPGTPALDYERVKEFFFSKLEGDLYGRGRMESAVFHTVQWEFSQGCAEREALLARIAELEARFGEWTPIAEAMPPERVAVIVTDCANSWPAFHEDEAWKFWTPHGSAPGPIWFWTHMPRNDHA